MRPSPKLTQTRTEVSIWSCGTVKIYSAAKIGTDNRNIFSRTMQFNLLSKCFYEPTHSHSAELMERERGKAERGRERKNKKEGTNNDYLWPLDYVPVLGELQAFVGVLISRVCNQRNPFCCRAQPRPSPPSHQSSECLDPATANTVCHNFCVQFVFIL